MVLEWKLNVLRTILAKTSVSSLLLRNYDIITRIQETHGPKF